MTHQVDAKAVLRAYHWVPCQHALNNLGYRRLKIARLDDLDDPFDLWAVAHQTLSCEKGYPNRKQRWRDGSVFCVSTIRGRTR
jgi:hypothetical protein